MGIALEKFWGDHLHGLAYCRNDVIQQNIMFTEDDRAVLTLIFMLVFRRSMYNTRESSLSCKDNA